MINTIEPVVIQNCYVRSRGVLISSLRDSTNITIRNCVGTGLNPNKLNTKTGRFGQFWKPTNLLIENNTLISTSGIDIKGGGVSSNSIVVRYNRAKNIDGRTSDGNGGYLLGTFCSQMVQLNGVRATPGIEIAWNEVINEPGKSCAEENINIYKTSGTAASPAKIHNNYVQGAYSTDPLATKYSGGGIIADGGSNVLAEETGYLKIYENQLVGTQNQAIAVSAGHDIDVRNNRAIGSGLLPDGQRMMTANVGIYVWNYYKTTGTFNNITVTSNVVGWINKSGSLNNFWFPDCTSAYSNNCSGNQPMSGSITLATEANELALWNSKVANNGVKLGSTLPY